MITLRRGIQLLALPFMVGMFGSTGQAATPAFPGAQGAGAVSVGGRGGQVIEVTNLNDSGTGSLRAAVQASGPRTVVFRVGGTIALQSQLKIDNPYITIAGQTAPGGGILIKGSGACNDVVRPATHDIIIRYIRVRVGYSTCFPDQTGDAISLYGNVSNIIYDHTSASWALDETYQLWSNGGAITNITFSNNLLAEALSAHSTVIISGAQDSATAAQVGPFDLHHNLLMNSSHRQPLLFTSPVRMVNNLFYNWGFYATQAIGGVNLDAINNVYKAGPLDPGVHEIQVSPTNNGYAVVGNPSIYVSGNQGPHNSNPSADNWSMVQQITGENGSETGTLSSSFRRTTPLSALPIPIVPTPTANLVSNMMPDVGDSARLDCNGNWVPNRDSVDTRLIGEYQNGTGFIPTTENDVGGFPTIANGTPCTDSDHDGMPDAWETAHGLNPNNAADGNQTDSSTGFTYLEDYLGGNGGTTTPPPPPPPTGSCTNLSFVSGSVSPASVVPNGAYTFSCDYGTTATRNIDVTTGSGSCVWSAFSGTKAVFNCTAGATAGTFTNSCVVTAAPDNNCAQTNPVNSLTVGTVAPPPPPPPPSSPPPTSGCPSSITCVPIQSGQTIAQALASTAGSGKYTELTPGTYATHEVDFPAHSRLYCDAGANITDVPGYTQSEQLFALHNSDIIISGNCNLSMPTIFPAGKADKSFSYVGNCIDIRGTVNGITLNPGLSMSQCAQDGVYIREATNVLVDGITATNPARNAMSITGQINGVTVQNSSLGGAKNLSNAQIADGIDVEGNNPADYVTNLTLNHNDLSNNQQRGLYISLYFLHTGAGTVSTPVTMNVVNNTANGNSLEGYNWSDGESGSVPHSIVCGANLTNGSTVQPIPGCNGTSSTPPPSGGTPPPPPPTGGCTNLSFVSGAVSPSNVQPGGAYTFSCDYGTTNSRNIDVNAGSGSCVWSAFSGTKAVFNCTAGTAVGTFSNSCRVDAAPDNNCAQTNPVNALTVGTSPVMMISQSSLGFSAMAGGAAPAAQTMSLSNAGSGTLNWTATKTKSWVSMTPMSGQNGPTMLTVSVNPTGMAAGTYNDTLTFGDPTVGTKMVPVTMTVASAPPPPTGGCTNLGFVSGSVSPANVQPNGAYTFSCDYGTTNSRNINVSAGSGSCIWSAFSGTTGVFNCTAGATAGTFNNNCLVDAAPDNNCAQTNPVNALTVGTVTQPPVTGQAFITSQTLGTLRNNYSGFVGVQFVVGSAPMQVNALGRMMVAGNSGSHTVKLVDVSANTDVPGASVSISMAGGTAGTYVYQSLASPVTLTAGRTYDLVTLEAAGGDRWYDLDTTLRTSADGSATQATYNDGSWHVLAGANHAYGPVNLAYTLGVVTPPPTGACTNVSFVSGSVSPTTVAPGGAYTMTCNYGTTASRNFDAAPGSGSCIWSNFSGTSNIFNCTAGPTAGTFANRCLVDAAPDTTCPQSNPINSLTVSGSALPSQAFITGQTLGTVRNNYSGFVGGQFIVGSSPIQVSSLGRLMASGNTGSHTVKLVDVSANADVSGGSIAISMTGGTVGSYVYKNLPAPVTLAAGHTYDLVTMESSGGDKWYDFDTTVRTTADGSVTQAIYNDGSWHVLGGAGRSYGPVNFTYSLGIGGVSNLQAAPGSIILSWKNPGDTRFNGVTIYKSTTGFVKTPDAAFKAMETTDVTWHDKAVTPGTMYYYTVFTHDANGVLSDPSFISYVAPQEMPAPGLNLPAVMSTKDTMQASYPASFNIVNFKWTVTPKSTTANGAPALGMARSLSNNAAGAAGVGAVVFNSQASLAVVGVPPGDYDVSVQAQEDSGRMSPAASASVTLVDASIGADSVGVHPNPWRKDRHTGLPITFDHLAAGSTVKVFTVAGHLVKTLTPVAGSAMWDLTNDSGDKAASGIYIYLATDGQGNKSRGKLVIIK